MGQGSFADRDAGVFLTGQERVQVRHCDGQEKIRVFDTLPAASAPA
jgi:hypothetical protein